MPVQLEHALDTIDIQSHKARIAALVADLNNYIPLIDQTTSAEIKGMLAHNELSCLNQVRQVMNSEVAWIEEITLILKDKARGEIHGCD